MTVSGQPVRNSAAQRTRDPRPSPPKFLFRLVARDRGLCLLSQTLVERAESDVERIKGLVAAGTLAPSSLEQAKERLADARDQATLSDTLYSSEKLQSMTPEQETAMVAAAERRVDREQTVVEARQKLLDMGIISQNEMSGVRDEMNSRRMVLDLARNRVKLLEELREMAAEEQRMQIPTVANSMIRYDGTASFKLEELPMIEKDFKAKFHHDLPVSAVGQTAVHQGLGLDHRNKVDVALNPEQPEGLWLRHYLERLHLPYLAFRNAVTGAATGAHIHIGTGSMRLAMAVR